MPTFPSSSARTASKAVRPGKMLRQWLQTGLSPRRLSCSLAVGITLGLAPLLWGSSLLCALVAWRLRLNHGAVQLANYLCYPLQLLLLAPFFIAGQRLFDPGHKLSLELWRELFAKGPLALGRQFWWANLCALAVWLLAAPLLLAGAHAIFYALLRYRQHQTADENFIRRGG